MNILSISRGHNSSTTLMVDGEIIFYLEEERLSRFKYDGTPFAGIVKALEYVDHIDHLIICHTHEAMEGQVTDWTREDYYVALVRKLLKAKTTYEGNDIKYPFEVYKVSLTHHELHASIGFFNSGFETAACVIADGAGSFLKFPKTIDWVKNSTALMRTQNPMFEFETIFHVEDPMDFKTVYKHIGSNEPIGLVSPASDLTITEFPGLVKMYEAVTQYCGFPAIEAGKTMGLSSYGKPNDEIPPIMRNGWGNRDLFIPTYPNAAEVVSDRYDCITKDMATWDGKGYTDFQKDMAYAVQEATSEAICKLIEKAHEVTGEKNIVICGGYGLNCVANYKYAKRFPELNIYVEPISHDGGTSMGGAKKCYYEVSGGERPKNQSTIYYGPKYDPETYEDSIKDFDVSDTSYDDVAKLIREGNIVTIFQGRSEAGPRALGNRSILFDPTIKDGKDIVNKVKHREFFRPFACSILAEKVHDWFDLAGMDDSPSMMYAVDALDGVEEKIPSVIHVDGTCRIQTVTPEQNKHYYNLISAFEKITEVPILFNTSFNLGGEPLVETIDDAVETLKNSDIEYLYLPELQKIVKIENEEGEEEEQD
tara:strand:- start:2624 stop:4402 length:1779 start_codon:yes stop_codon:yes gene_type:complete